MSNPIVLIAEDDANTREILRVMLEVYGYDVISAEDAMLAYGLLSTAHPDVIIVDLFMPDVDGIGLIRWIRANEEYRDTPIIAMTAGSEEILTEALEMGATATVKKPNDISKLASIINGILDKSKAATSEDA